ncbi:MAG: hypothetical protein Q8O27_00590 [Enterobacteriaceae bacterium]|nr:hypothetical protein [Enterobacteriaceae bacterium]
MTILKNYNQNSLLIINKNAFSCFSKNIITLNRFIKNYNTNLIQIKGFKKLIEQTNKSNNCYVFIGHLNHINTIIRFYCNKVVKIEQVDINNNKNGSNPDLLINCKNEKYAIEIKTINEKEFDKEETNYFLRKTKEDPGFLYDIPNKLGTSRNPIYPENWVKYMSQLNNNNNRKNILMFLTNLSPMRNMENIINRFYEQIQIEFQNNKNNENKIEFLYKLHDNYIKEIENVPYDIFLERFHRFLSKTIILWTDKRNPLNKNYILPNNQNIIKDKDLLWFLKTKNFKCF